MTDTPDPETVAERLSWLAAETAPGASPAHLSEAVAIAFGFDTHAAMLAAFRAGGLDPDLDFSECDFEETLLDLGFEGEFGDLDLLARQSEAAVLPLLPPGRHKLPDGSVVEDGTYDFMERIEASIARRQEQVIAALAARGLPPAERGEIFSLYSEPLSYGFRWLPGSPGQIEIRIGTKNRDHADRKHSAGGDRPVWGRRWPDYGVVVSGADLLAFLALEWPLLVSDFLMKPEARNGVADFRAGIGRPDLPRFEIAVQGREIEVRADRGRCRPGAEGLMVAESLLTLGNELAGWLAGLGIHGAAVAAWAEARKLDDLPPTEADRGDFDTPGPECVRAGAAYYARRLGLPPDTYLDVALFESAAHLLWHVRGKVGAEPGGGDGFRAVVLGTLPSPAEIRRMADEARTLDTGRVKAAGYEPVSPEEWELDALRQLNTDARAMVFYRGWPDRPPPMPVIPADLDPASLIGRVVSFRDGREYTVTATAGLSAVGEPMLRLRGTGRHGRETEFDWWLSDVLAKGSGRR